jgi:HAD superfamily hydrolase (TIGR01458 family)
MKITGVIIDLDGVLYTGDSVIPGAADAVRYLRNKGYIIRYLSNTTRKSRITIESRLRQYGFDISRNDIITPAIAAISYIRKSSRINCHLLTLGDVNTEFESAGLPSQDQEVDWVVVGDAGDNFSYERMNTAFRLALEGADILALEKDRYWMGTGGLMLSAGPFVDALEYATGKSAVVMGKPSPEFFRMALESMGVIPREAVMIGDDMTSDIGGAIRAGLHGILVKTGKFSAQALHAANPGPDAVIESLASVRDIL